MRDTYSCVNDVTALETLNATVKFSLAMKGESPTSYNKRDSEDGNLLTSCA